MAKQPLNSDNPTLLRMPNLVKRTYLVRNHQLLRKLYLVRHHHLMRTHYFLRQPHLERQAPYSLMYPHLGRTPDLMRQLNSFSEELFDRNAST